jgi:aminopeptidase N
LVTEAFLMTRKFYFVFSMLFVTGISSCRLIGINYKHVPPKKPGKYKTFTAADSLRGYYGPLRQNNDVTFYDLYICPDAGKKTLSGKVSVYFTALTEMEQMQLDLHQEMKIGSITMEGKPLQYQRNLTSFFVQFDSRLLPGEKHVIEISFSGKPKKARKPPWEGGLVWKTDKQKNPWTGVACENDGAALWWPLKDHIRDEPDSVSISIEVPSKLTGVANGRLLTVTDKGSNKVYTWHTGYPINPYNITFYVGNFKHAALPCDGCTIDGVDFYVLPEHLDKAKEHFRQVARIIAFYEKAFGPYPWPKDGYKLVESPFEGMEHQSAIAYGNGYQNMYLGVDYIVLHETAHEWWGNAISAGDFADVWLHEGMATYCEVLYVEEVYGINAMQDYIVSEGATVKNKFPVVGPRDVSYWNYKDGDRYNKGAVVLHTLRNTLHNDTLFRNILKTFYREHAGSIVNTQMFIDHVNNRTGKDYTWFFNQYLFKAQVPVLEGYHQVNREDQTISFFYRWAKTGDDFVMPVDLEVDGVPVLIYPTATFKEYRYKWDQKVFSPLYNFYYYYKKVKRPK